MRADRERAAALAQERRLCSLEVNALLACGAASVVVADPRWCRRFPLPGGEGAAGLPARGDELLASVGGDSVVGYDLPQAQGAAISRRGPLRRRGAPPLAGLDAVAAWRRAQGGVPDGEAPRPGPGEGEPEARAPGARLLAGAGEAAWTAWLRSVAMARERGDAGAWLLAVGPTPPAGAAALAAAYPTAAPTVAGADGASAPRPPLGPVLWAAPETLADPGLRAAIAARPPLAAFALGLEAWLPTAPRPRYGAAVALRFLARDLPRTEICLGGLPGPWRRLLADFLAAGPSSGETAAPDLLADVPEEFLPADSAAARCPDCGGGVPLVGARPACAACGLDLSTWQGEGQRDLRRRAVLRARLDGLRRRVAAGQEFVCHVNEDEYSIIKEEVKLIGMSVREAEGRLTASDGNSTWRVLQLADAGIDPPGGAVVRLGLSTGIGEGLASAGRPLIVAGHPDDLDAPELPPAAARLARAVALVSAGAGPEPPAWARGCRGAVPAAVVEALTGLPAEGVAASLVTLAWLSVLETGREPARAAAAAAAAPAVLHLALPLAELESRLGQAAALAAARLPGWLDGAVEGLPVVCDLAVDADGDSEEELAWLDRFLLAMSLRLRGAAPTAGGGDLFRGTTGTEELLWRAPDGVLFSSRRLVGTLGRPRAVAERLS
ncbi:MAG: hypothetical protein ACYDIE_14680, partial [Candidatus Krumholzibacteriia bacterium]